MEFLDRLPLPRRLSSKVWLISLPSALLSFERRQKLPELPIGQMRLLGIPLIGLGVALAAWSWRNPGTVIAYSGPGSHLARRPATAGGILVLAGASLLARSLVLAAYSLGLVVAAESEQVTIEDPTFDVF